MRVNWYAFQVRFSCCSRNLAWLGLLLCSVLACAASYVNPLLTSNSADPWVYRTNGYYYYTRTTGGNVRVFRSATLEGLGSATAVTVFTPNGEILSDIWAPELHYLDSKWYIYSTGNTSSSGGAMRMFVLEGNTQNPQGTYTYKGLLDTNTWGIDATVLVRPSDGAKFLIWSRSDSYGQSLYAAPMSNPWTLGGPAVRISSPEYSWEKNGRVNEGPEILIRNGKTFIIYSASGTWTEYYCLGLLVNTDGDYTNPNSWTKFSNPVFQRYPANGTYCVGHCSFTKSPSGVEDWLVYHGTSDPSGDQTSKRYTRIQPFIWNSDDTPNFDVPTAAGVLLLSPDEAPGKPTQGLVGEYFNNTNLTGAAVLSTNYTMDFGWGTGAPLLSIAPDAFSARWSGLLYAPTSGTYVVKVACDDGARLAIGGQTLVNDWNVGSLRTNAASVSLEGNKYYPIRLEYFEKSSSAILGLRWVAPGGVEQVIPGKYLFPFTNGLCGEYFNNTGALLTARIDPAINFNWGNGIPAVGVPADAFNVRWTGRVEPAFSGTYTFYVNSANGRRLWIGNNLIIDKWFNDGPVEYSGTIELEAGKKYDLKLEYFAAYGAASCQLMWSCASQTKQVIPQSRLFLPFNQPPSLATVAPQHVLAGSTLVVTNIATDPDDPAQSFAFSLLLAPENASINATNGLFTWRPTISEAGLVRWVQVAVTDSGYPPLSATQTFVVIVDRPSSPQVVASGSQSGGIDLMISGDQGPDYFIEGCEDLSLGNWTILFSTNSPPLPFLWEDRDAVGRSRRFYRIRLGP